MCLRLGFKCNPDFVFIRSTCRLFIYGIRVRRKAKILGTHAVPRKAYIQHQIPTGEINGDDSNIRSTDEDQNVNAYIDANPSIAYQGTCSDAAEKLLTCRCTRQSRSFLEEYIRALQVPTTSRFGHHRNQHHCLVHSDYSTITQLYRTRHKT